MTDRKSGFHGMKRLMASAREALFPGASSEPRGGSVRLAADLPATQLDGDRASLDSLGAYLPYDELIEAHFMALSAAEPGRPEGLGFTIEVIPQTGVTEEMQKTLLTLGSLPLPIGSTIAMTAYASPEIEGLLEAWTRSHVKGGRRPRSGFPRSRARDGQKPHRALSPGGEGPDSPGRARRSSSLPRLAFGRHQNE